MTKESSQLHEADPDKTDKLPILEGVTFDPDVADDAVRMDHASRPVAPVPAGASPDFIRSPIDLPSLAVKACVRLRNVSLVRAPNWR